MPKTRSGIPLNDGALSILRTGVEVSYETPGVNVRRLLVLLVCENIGGGGGRWLIAAPMESLHPPGDTIPETSVPSMGRPKIMAMSCSVTVAFPHGRWNVWVSGRHQSTSAINAAESIISRPPLMRRASGRNLARCTNDVYHSSHDRRLCMWILSGDSHCGTQQYYKNISPNR
jgi:hypothetical protein